MCVCVCVCVCDYEKRNQLLSNKIIIDMLIKSCTVHQLKLFHFGYI